MKKLLLIFLLLGNLPPVLARGQELCSAIHNCQVEKKSWTKNVWSIEYSKRLSFAILCAGSSEALQLEPELGLELSVLNGNGSSGVGFKTRPYINANLYSYKLTHVVAAGAAPLDVSAFSFSHRLMPRGKSIIEVSCTKD